MKPVNILIVEDNPGDVFLFKEGIERQSLVPINVTVVSDGEAAVRAFDGHAAPPDLMLLDLNLPKLDGFEVLQMLRQTNDQVPVIVITSSENKAHIRRAYELGAAAFVTKPTDFDRLLQVIRGICTGWIEPMSGEERSEAVR